MAHQVLSSGSLLIDDPVRQSAESLAEEARNRDVAAISVTWDDGATRVLDGELTELLQSIIHMLPAGNVTVRSLPEELTSTTAADILGVSRPTLMKFVGDGLLASHRVGSHHRFAREDVMRLAEQREQARQDAFVKLRELDEAAEMSE